MVVVGWGGGGGGLFDYSVNLWPRFIKIKAKFGQTRLVKARARSLTIFKIPALKSLVVGGGGVACLIIVSTPGPCFVFFLF